MGHKRQRKTLSLTFEDEPGLEVLMRSCSVRRFLWAVRVVNEMAAGKLREEVINEAIEWFAGRIISWNLEDDEDQPIAVSVGYLLDEDADWFVMLAKGWLKGVIQVMNIPLDLGQLERLAELGRQAQANGAEGPEAGLDLPMQPATPG